MSGELYVCVNVCVLPDDAQYPPTDLHHHERQRRWNCGPYRVRVRRIRHKDECPRQGRPTGPRSLSGIQVYVRRAGGAITVWGVGPRDGGDFVRGGIDREHVCLVVAIRIGRGVWSGGA